MNAHEYGKPSDRIDTKDDSESCSRAKEMQMVLWKCIPHMVKVFVNLRQDLLLRDNTFQWNVWEAKNLDWFWTLKAAEFNKVKFDAVNQSWFWSDTSYPGALGLRNHSHRHSYTLTALKRKA